MVIPGIVVIPGVFCHNFCAYLRCMARYSCRSFLLLSCVFFLLLGAVEETGGEERNIMINGFSYPEPEHRLSYLTLRGARGPKLKSKANLGLGHVNMPSPVALQFQLQYLQILDSLPSYVLTILSPHSSVWSPIPPSIPKSLNLGSYLLFHITIMKCNVDLR